MTSKPWYPAATRRRSILGAALVLSVSLLLAGISVGMGTTAVTASTGVADASLTIDRITTVTGDERVDGVVKGQPIELHLRYAGLGDGVHTVHIQDVRSDEHVLNTTVVGDSGTEQVGIDGAALADAYSANDSVIELAATVPGATSDTYQLEKVDLATMYLTGVPDEAGRNDSVTVTYYGWTRGSVDVRLVADVVPRGSNDGEDVLIDQLRIDPPPGTSLPYEFEGTVRFTPSQYLTSPSADDVVIHVRESTRQSSGTYWGNSQRIEITNHRPVADFDYSPTSPQVNRSIAFNASGSTDADGQIIRYEWDFDDDGRIDTTGQTVTHTFPTGGDRTVSLTVTDDAGATNTLRTRLTVIAPPRPVVTLSPADPVATQPITFDASESSDPDGTIERYVWDFENDGTTDAVGSIVTHAYSIGGNYLVSLRVIDDDGASTVVRRAITVAPLVRPTANLAYRPHVPAVNQSVVFDASASTDPDGRIVRYEWELGDGTHTNATQALVRHAYSNVGTYTVTVTATDNDGDSRSRKMTITVENRAPDAVFGYQPFRPKVGNGIRFDASNSGDVDGQIEHFRWDFDGDGTPDASGGPVVTHTYERRGTYTVTLIVEDDMGATDVATREVRVAPILPWLELVLLTVLVLWAIGVFWLSGMLSLSRLDIDFSRFDFRHSDDVPDDDIDDPLDHD